VTGLVYRCNGMNLIATWGGTSMWWLFDPQELWTFTLILWAQEVLYVLSSVRTFTGYNCPHCCAIFKVSRRFLQSHRHVCKCYVLTWGSWLETWLLHQYLEFGHTQGEIPKISAKTYISIQGGGWNSEYHQFWWFLSFTSLSVSWAPPLLLHRFSLLLPVQLL
jgi:hypothetical protein